MATSLTKDAFHASDAELVKIVFSCHRGEIYLAVTGLNGADDDLLVCHRLELLLLGGNLLVHLELAGILVKVVAVLIKSKL